MGGGALVNNAGSFILCPSDPVSFGGTATVHTGTELAELLTLLLTEHT